MRFMIRNCTAETFEHHFMLLRITLAECTNGMYRQYP